MSDGLRTVSALESVDAMLEVIRAKYAYAIADANSLRAERDRLRGVVEGLLGVLGSTVSPDEITRWRKLAGMECD